MEHFPRLITDLALLLSVAAVAIILCKRLKQPLVLGYVLAGVIVGPAIGWLPGISDTASISTWSEIGMVFLMFGLGLEFSVVKLATVGKPAIITACLEVVLMGAAGFAVAYLLGWPIYTCLFLAGMLAMSSTTIIIKALEELGLKEKPFAKLIFGALVVEDIVGIFLMVLLSTIAASNAANSGAIVVHIGIMALYLILWFVLSVALIPALLKRVSGALNDEVLLIVSIALCFCMVLIAHAIGFSVALGAFIAGSILAGTMHGHRIEKLFKPVKDLFGAIFFVSVGMMVSPAAMWQNIVPILVITALVLIGKPIFSGLGALLGRQPLSDSVYLGMGLSQIGEFSFIIAGVGITLGVTEGFLYPVIVAVSVITTLTTPYYLKGAPALTRFLTKRLPASLVRGIDAKANTAPEDQVESPFGAYLKRQTVKVVMVFLAALVSVEVIAMPLKSLLRRYVSEPELSWGLTILALVITGIFISNLLGRNERSSVVAVWAAGGGRWPSLLVVIGSFLLSFLAVLYVLHRVEMVGGVWLIVLTYVATLVMSNSRGLQMRFLHVESLFLGNLNENILAERRRNVSAEERLSEAVSRAFVLTITAGRGTRLEPGDEAESGPRSRAFRRQRLNQVMLAQATNIDLFAVFRDGERLDTPNMFGRSRRGVRQRREEGLKTIRDGDRLVFLGTKEGVDSYLNSLTVFGYEPGENVVTQSLEQYLADAHHNTSDLSVFSVQVDRASSLRGMLVGELMVDGCKVLEVERNLVPIVNPGFTFRLAPSDTVWLLGDPADLA